MRAIRLRALPPVLLALAFAGCAGGAALLHAPDILYVATPESVGVEMLRLAGVTSGDVVYDLGSGDGRLVIAAAREFGARGIGVEIEPSLVQMSREGAAKAGVAERATFIWQDLFATDIGAATVVTLYLRDDVNLKLRPKLLHELRPGTRVVSHDFGMADWTPERVVRVHGPDREHRVSLWLVPADVAGVWRTGGPTPAAATLTLAQRFQRVTAVLESYGARTALDGRLEGDRLRLAGGGVTLEARVQGERMSGQLTMPGARPADWSAERARRD